MSDGPERVLDAALEVFSQRGFRGGSLNEIATRSGYTRAGLLHHFPSKEALLVAVLEKWASEVGLTTLVTTGNLSLVELADTFEGYIHATLEHRQFVLLAHIMSAEAGGDAHPAREWVKQRDQRLRDGIAATIRRSIDRGEYPADVDPDATAAVILAVVVGLEDQWLINPEAVDPVASIKALRQITLAPWRDSSAG